VYSTIILFEEGLMYCVIGSCRNVKSLVAQGIEIAEKVLPSTEIPVRNISIGKINPFGIYDLKYRNFVKIYQN